MTRLSIPAALAAIALIAGCGGSSDSQTATVPGGGDPGDVAVIKGWVDSLREGEVEKAASYFAIPAVVENGTPPLRLTSRREVIAFNEALPCGAKLVSATSTGRFTTATFTLTERRGGAGCGTGAGQRARTNFVIKDGKITEWRRVADEAPPPPGQTA